MLASFEVHLFDERGEGGRFATANRAGDEDEPVLETGEQLQAFGQAELIHGANAGADDAEDDIDPETLPDDAGAETPEVVCIGEIHVAALLELRALGLVQKACGQGRGILGAQFRRVRPDWLEITMETPERLGIDPEMDIGSAALLSDRKILINVRHGGREVGGDGNLGGHARSGCVRK